MGRKEVWSQSKRGGEGNSNRSQSMGKRVRCVSLLDVGYKRAASTEESSCRSGGRQTNGRTGRSLAFLEGRGADSTSLLRGRCPPLGGGGGKLRRDQRKTPGDYYGPGDQKRRPVALGGTRGKRNNSVRKGSPMKGNPIGTGSSEQERAAKGKSRGGGWGERREALGFGRREKQASLF